MIDEEKVTIEFELELYNRGSAPARDVLIEASMFNAGADQDQEIGRSSSNPAGEGDRIADDRAAEARVDPDRRSSMPLDQVQRFEAADACSFR